ncbi:MAG: hypothetical protein IKK61_07750, partial [Clostridia bacterium]|nr:hypothetical protein [Clostridia bacterium]
MSFSAEQFHICLSLSDPDAKKPAFRRAFCVWFLLGQLLAIGCQLFLVGHDEVAFLDLGPDR